MSLINKEILPFTANAYDPKKDEFFEISDENLKGSWSVVCFYPADFSGEVCPAKWEEGSETLQPGLDLVGKI